MKVVSDWMVSYAFGYKNNLQILSMKSLEEFGEKGVYTEDEAKMVVDFLRTLEVPEFKATHWWGSKTYEEWDVFVRETNQKIKELIEKKGYDESKT